MNEIISPFFLSLIIGGMVFYVCYKNMPAILDWLRWRSIGQRDYIVETLGKMFIDIEPNKVLLYMILTSITPGLLIFLIILPQLVPAIIFACVVAILAWNIPKMVVSWLHKRRTLKFNLQMVDALGLMANGMKSGLSIIQALGLVKNEMPEPLSQEFDYILRQNQIGVSIEDAFQNLAKRIPSDDVNMFVTAIVILKETGGNLAETFETISYTIRERIKVEQKISAMVSSGLGQGIIIFCMPFALAIMFYLTDPEFIAPLVSTPIGWIAVAIILFLQFLGGFMILKIVQIKV